MRLRDGPEAWSVQWFESMGVNATTGAPRFHQRGLTTPRVTAASGAAVAQAGRGRWQLANTNHHVLQTKGSQVAHTCGPGTPSLSAGMRSRNRRALLCHPGWEWRDDTYAWLRRVRARRQTFFDAIRA